MIHKHLNFHQMKWSIFFELHKNVEDSAKDFEFRGKSTFSEAQYIFKKVQSG